ncbi:MAG: 3-oxocholest-4-en-26-oyl-CoA dehydrogenase beta subunit [Actinomycetota bacterium]
MDFTFDETQQDLRKLAAQIVEQESTVDRVRELEAGTERIDRRLWAELAKANLLGLAVPEEHGGSGLSILEAALVLEAVGRHVAAVPVLATVVMGALPVAAFGNDDLKRRLLPGVVEGETFLTAAMQEAANPQPLRPVTRATEAGGEWRLDGEKVAVPWAMLADHLLVTADAGVFVVAAGADGLTVERAEATHREPQGHVTLRATPAERLAGPEANAFLYQHALAGLCATAVGVLEGALRITAAYITEREQFGKPIAAFQGATMRIADAYIDAEAVAATTWSAIWRLADGRPAADALAMAKFWVADGGQRVVHAAQHLHGGMGVDVDYPIHRYFLWAKELELTLGGATPQLLDLGASLVGANS